LIYHGRFVASTAFGATNVATVMVDATLCSRPFETSMSESGTVISMRCESGSSARMPQRC
jgi:hypothetical protein